jgi:hypothetical protein
MKLCQSPLIRNQQVDGSIPPAGSREIKGLRRFRGLFLLQAVSRTNLVKPGTNQILLPAERPAGILCGVSTRELFLLRSKNLLPWEGKCVPNA